MSSSATSLAWRWVVEALADTDQLKTSTLAELVRSEGRHVLLNDPLLNERISLACLRQLLHPISTTTAAATADVPMPRDDNTIIDFSVDAASRAEDVLCALLQKGIPDDVMYRQELGSFILHKRAALPKCYLQLLVNSFDQNCSDSVRDDDGLRREFQVDHSQNNCNNLPEGRERLLKLTDGCDEIPSQEVFPGLGHHSVEVDGLLKSQRNPVYAENTTTRLSHTLGSQQGLSNGANTKNLDPTELRANCSEHEGCVESTSDEDESQDAAPVGDFINEILASQKQKLVSSQNAYDYDSMTGTETQQQLCIKCEKGGQLLLCSASSCPIAVHASCWSFTIGFQDTGEFYCPFCSYIQASHAYRNAKKRVSMCRTALTSFVGLDPVHKRKVVQPTKANGSSNPKKNVQESHHAKDYNEGNRGKTQETPPQKGARDFVDDSSKSIPRKGKKPIVFHEK